MQLKQDKAKESCMVSFRRLHSYLKRLSNNDLKGTRTECGFKRAFAILFGQNVETFTGTMFLNIDQLEKQLDKEEFQEIGSMAAFKTTSLIAKNDEFKVQLQEKGFAFASSINELRKLLGNSVNTKFARTSILGKLVLQPHRNQSVVRQPTAFKSERPRISKPRFASQIDVNIDLSKPVTTHYLPKERKSKFGKPYHMTASSKSMNSSKNMPIFSSNDMVHNHYLEEAKRKTQKKGKNSEPSVMPSSRSQSTANGSKQKSMINNQNSNSWHASKSSCVTTKTVPIAEHSRNHYKKNVYLGRGKTVPITIKTVPNAIWHDLGTVLPPS
nr:hypothetical protein [Tanacetum cinerariifolium]